MKMKRLSLKFVKESAQELLLSVEKIGRNKYEIFNSNVSIVVFGGLSKVVEVILGNDWKQRTGYSARINKPLPE